MSNLPAVFFRNAHGPFQRIDHYTMRRTCNMVPYTGTSTPRINDSAKGAVHNPTTTHTRGGDSCNPYHWRHSVLLNIVHPAHPCPGYLVRAAGCHPSGCHRSGCTRYRKSKMRGNTKPLTHTMKPTARAFRQTGRLASQAPATRPASLANSKTSNFLTKRKFSKRDSGAIDAK